MCFGIFSFLFAFSFNHRTPLRKEEVDASYNGGGGGGAGVRQRTLRSLHIIYATSIMAFFPIKLSFIFLST